MINEDEDALICDLAETYGILDYRNIPVGVLATLSCGLREDSRIKMKLASMKVPIETILLSAALDRLSFIAWTKTSDAENGLNRPGSVTAILSGHKNEKEIIAFDSAEEFEQAKARAQGRL